ncbi:hypothetical protein CA13_30280 [Planctomycetes bacterium CA13]|uniref:Acylphosphatase n=1 Tax=Novipirellula herctigrandis TaxID=2527986 RepID=A0A5C5Z318_9BACT|nr:hypothetical protein CA13_30280 [Planctomycetes bacterium CA13]
MMPSEQRPQFAPAKPGCYRIAVQGCLDEQKWSGRLSGMRIASQIEDDQQAVTILNGEVRDQAELIGILNTLYQPHMNILSVNGSPCNQPNANHETSS